MAMQTATITASIAALSISGIKSIKDIDEIPAKIRSPRDLPMLIPYIPDFLSQFVMTETTFGQGTTAKSNLNYILTYVYLHAEIGQDRSATLKLFGPALSGATSVIDKILDNDALEGAVDIRPFGNVNMGIVFGPDDEEYFGTLLQFRVLEFDN